MVVLLVGVALLHANRMAIPFSLAEMYDLGDWKVSTEVRIRGCPAAITCSRPVACACMRAGGWVGANLHVHDFVHLITMTGTSVHRHWSTYLRYAVLVFIIFYLCANF